MIKLKDLSVRNKMFILIGIFVAGFVIFGIFAFNTLNTVRIGSDLHKELVKTRVFQNDAEAPSLFILQTVYFANRLQQYVEQENMAEVKETIDDINKGIATYQERHDFWAKEDFDKEIKEIAVVKADKPAQEYFNIVKNELIPAALRGDEQKVSELNNGILKEKYIEHRNFLNETVKMTDEYIEKTKDEANSIVSWRTTILLIISIFIIGLVLLVGWLITRTLVGPLTLVAEKLKLISLGDVNQTLDYQSKDEIGSLADAFRNLNIYFKDIAASVESLGKGELNAQISMRSDKDLVAKNVEHTIDSIQNLMGEVNKLIEAAQNGNLKQRGNETKFQGAYSQLIGGINQMMNSITLPINEASDVLGRIAAKDLTVPVNGDYKGEFAIIKNSLNTALDNLNEGLSQVSVGAEQVASAANEISSGSQALAQGASEQASTLEEVSSSLQEISSITRQNTANSQEARSLSDSAKQSAERGMDSMNQLSQAVEKIKESSDSTAKIVKTIEEIAFQTNLLALNAAVEAARAGDAGKGFAVVAEEVRNLAMRSADAAKTTAQLIEESVRNTESGVSLNAEVLTNLEEINHQIEKVNIVVTEIAAASEQQNQGVEQINVAVEQLNGVTQQTAANSEESASASEELSGQSQEMLSLLNRFKLSGDKQVYRSSSYSAPTAYTMTAAVKPAYTTNGGKKKTFSTKKKGNEYRNQTNAIDPGNLIPFDDMDNSVLKEF